MTEIGSNAAAKAEYPRIVIKCDTVSIKTICALCDADMREGPGPELYLEGTIDAVCCRCGEKYAPELAAALEAYWNKLREQAIATEQVERDELAIYTSKPDTPFLRWAKDAIPGLIVRRLDDEAIGLKGQLLWKYADKEPRRFRQFDAEVELREDGPEYFVGGGQTQELMTCAHIDVRVLIPLETAQSDAVALLRRIADVIESEGLERRPYPDKDELPF